MAKARQLTFFKTEKSDYGGALMTMSNCRARPRPLAIRSSMHLVLKSSLAKGEWSLRRHRHAVVIISKKFCERYGVKLLALANVGNHLHYHIQLTQRRDFAPFIRALTGALAMAVTKASRWHRPKSLKDRGFWDNRPFTRIVAGFRDFLNVNKYLMINHFEAQGLSRVVARELVNQQHIPRLSSG